MNNIKKIKKISEEIAELFPMDKNIAFCENCEPSCQNYGCSKLWENILMCPNKMSRAFKLLSLTEKIIKE